MQNNKFLVLDIGSSKLRLAELEFEEDKLELDEYQEVSYAGFTDGAFIEDDFESSCKELFKDCNKEEISCVYVGVPSEFCGLTVKEITSTFDSPIDLNGHTRQEFLKYAESEEMVSKITDGIVIDVNILDLSKRNSSNEDENSGSINITGQVSYIFADSNFLDKVTNTLQGLGFSDIEFSSSVNAQCNQMITENMRDVGVVLGDIGYLTTSVAVVKGGGIKNLRSFSLGGAHISAELCENLNMPFKIAQKLQKKVLLTVDPSEVDYYVVSSDDNDYEFQASKVNKIVNAKIDHIALMISKCLTEEDYAYQFIVTGGALDDIKGAMDVLSSKLGVVVKEENIAFGDLEEPKYSAIVSLIKQAEQKIRGLNSTLPFWKKIINKIKSWFDF